MNFLGFVIEDYMDKKLEVIVKQLVFDELKMPRSGMVWNKDFEGNYALGYNKKGELIGAQKRESSRGAGSMVCAVSVH